MVNAGKKLANVKLQDVRKAAGKLLAAGAGAMRAFAQAVGIAVFNKAALKPPFNQVTEGMVYNPVVERGGTDQPVLGIVNKETMVTFGGVLLR